MSFNFTSIGHWLATAIPAIVGFEKKVAPAIKLAATALAKVQGTEAEVEGLTALIDKSGLFEGAEKAIYGGFGVAHDFLVALGTAATAGTVITLTVAGSSSTVTIDPAVAASILEAGKYIQSHPLTGTPPVIPAIEAPAAATGNAA